MDIVFFAVLKLNAYTLSSKVQSLTLNVPVTFSSPVYIARLPYDVPLTSTVDAVGNLQPVMVEPPFTIKSYWVTGDVNVQLLIVEPADNTNTQSPLPLAPSANFAVILYPPPLTVTPSGITVLAGTVTLPVNVYDDPNSAELINFMKSYSAAAMKTILDASPSTVGGVAGIPPSKITYVSSS